MKRITVVAALLLLVACSSYTALAQTYTYTTNYGSGDVSGFSLDPSSGALTPVAGSPFASGATPQGNLGGIVTDPRCKHVYAGNWGGTVSGYSIDPTTGNLTPVPGSPFAAGTQSAWVAIDPTSTYLYAINYGDSTISAYTIAGKGVLSPITGSPFALDGVNPDFAVIDASGKFLYVANQSSNDVSALTISSTGALTAVSGSPFAVGSSPRGLTIDPSNTHLYVSNTVSGDVSVFNINAATGALTELSDSPFAVRFNIYQLAIHPTGRFGWIGNDDGGLDGVAIASNGALSTTSGSPFSSITQDPAVAIDPSGQWLYADQQSAAVLTQYRIDATTGSATPMQSFATGSLPAYTAICSLSKALVSISVTPVNPSIATDATQQFRAKGTYSDGSIKTITTSVTWSSSNTSAATITSGGLATGVAPGSSNITASVGGISGGTTLTVNAALVSIAISSPTSSITVGQSTQFTALGTYSDGSTNDITAGVTWVSPKPTVATISAGGLATGAGIGSTNIKAKSSGITSNAFKLTVTQ